MTMHELWIACGSPIKRPGLGWWGQGRGDLLEEYAKQNCMKGGVAARHFGRYVAERRKEAGDA